MNILLNLLNLIFGKKTKPEDKTEGLKPCGVIGINESSSILLDKLEEIGDDKAEIYLPDTSIKVYNKADVIKCHELQEVSSIKYIASEMDCDDFAAMLYGMFAGLVWTNAHALCFFVDETGKFWFIEPQTGKIAEKLENWQGGDIRFFLMR